MKVWTLSTVSEAFIFKNVFSVSGKVDNKVFFGTSDNGCECVNYNCGCCAHLDVKTIHLDDTGNEI